MNFKELNQKLGGNENQFDWRQASGGGWIHRSAKVEREDLILDDAIVWGRVSGDAQVSGNAWVYGNAQVSGDAQVYDDAQVSGDAQVYGDAQVSGYAWVCGNARVSGYAQVYGSARVSGYAWVSGKAWVYGDAQVSGDARVSGYAQVYGSARVSGSAWVYGKARVFGDVWVKPVLFVLDSRGHGCSNCRHGWLKIGCEEHTFSDWKKHFPGIARKHNLTPAESKEYQAIVNFFCEIGI